MPPTFLYHAEAVGASGHISLPVVDTLPFQASIASALGGGLGSVRVESVQHLDYLTTGPVESHIVASHSTKDGAYGTLAGVTLENLNILNVVTCGRMVARLTSKHNDGGSAEASFILHGTRFENLRIAGHEFDFRLATGLLSELSTWDKLNLAYESDPGIRRELDELSLNPVTGSKLPVESGVFACTLAHIPPELPRGLSNSGHGIYVPHFGTVYPAVYYVSKHWRRLRMLHVELGCSVEGCYGFGDTGGNGQQLPGSN